MESGCSEWFVLAVGVIGIVSSLYRSSNLLFSLHTRSVRCVRMDRRSLVFGFVWLRSFAARNAAWPEARLCIGSSFFPVKKDWGPLGNSGTPTRCYPMLRTRLHSPQRAPL
jgi:hypothetical protein